MSYYYSIYGLSIKSNVMIDMVKIDKYRELVDVELILLLDSECDFNNIEMTSNRLGEYILKIPNMAVYMVTFDKIVCHAIDYNCFISTLFNIPFSVLLLLKGDLLVHACALNTSKGLVLLSGEKGVGKSTLSAMLCDENGFSFFADDTVRVDQNLIGYRAHNCMKLYSSVIERLGIHHNGKQNAAGKYFIDMDSKKQKAKCENICSIVFIRRGKSLQINRLNSSGNLLKRNIIGVEFFHSNLLKKLLNLRIEYDHLYQMIIPDGIEATIQSVGKIKKYIQNMDM